MGARRRIAAILEVLIAFAVVHVAFRAFKRFTELGHIEVRSGMNFSPGLIMAAVAVGLVALHGRRFADYGLNRRGRRQNLAIALACLSLMILAGVAFLLLGFTRDRARIGPLDGCAYALAGLGVTGLLMAWFQEPGVAPLRLPLRAGIAILLALLAVPLIASVWSERSFTWVLLAVLWRFFCAGVGEEVFFRGYVQSRLNEAFGRPWRLLGVRFGPGLIGAALLFGLVHVLNPFDYFTGEGSLAWWHGLATVAAPYGFLREKTGSVVCPAITHGLLDVVLLVPLLLAGSA